MDDSLTNLENEIEKFISTLKSGSKIFFKLNKLSKILATYTFKAKHGHD